MYFEFLAILVDELQYEWPKRQAYTLHDALYIYIYRDPSNMQRFKLAVFFYFKWLNENFYYKNSGGIQ